MLQTYCFIVYKWRNTKRSEIWSEIVRSKLSDAVFHDVRMIRLFLVVEQFFHSPFLLAIVAKKEKIVGCGGTVAAALRRLYKEVQHSAGMWGGFPFFLFATTNHSATPQSRSMCRPDIYRLILRFFVCWLPHCLHTQFFAPSKSKSKDKVSCVTVVGHSAR